MENGFVPRSKVLLICISKENINPKPLQLSFFITLNSSECSLEANFVAKNDRKLYFHCG